MLVSKVKNKNLTLAVGIFSLTAVTTAILGVLSFYGFAAIDVNNLVLNNLNSSKVLTSIVSIGFPIFILSLATAWLFRSGVYTVGIEGQFLMVIVAMVLILNLLPQYSAIVNLSLMIFAGLIASVIWACTPILVPNRYGALRVFVSLLANLVALKIISLINPSLLSLDSVSWGLNYYYLALFLVFIVLFSFLFSKFTIFSLLLQILGNSRKVANNLGLNTFRLITTITIITSILVVIAAIFNVSSSNINNSIVHGYGYAAIFIAVVCRESLVRQLILSGCCSFALYFVNTVLIMNGNKLVSMNSVSLAFIGAVFILYLILETLIDGYCKFRLKQEDAVSNKDKEANLPLR